MGKDREAGASPPVRVLEAGWIFLGTLLVLYKWRYLFWAYLFLTYLFFFFIEMQALVKTAS